MFSSLAFLIPSLTCLKIMLLHCQEAVELVVFDFTHFGISHYSTKTSFMGCFFWCVKDGKSRNIDTFASVAQPAHWDVFHGHTLHRLRPLFKRKLSIPHVYFHFARNAFNTYNIILTQPLTSICECPVWAHFSFHSCMDILKALHIYLIRV